MPALMTHKIKRGDRRPYIYATLGDVDEDDEVVPGSQPLTGATVVFNMRDLNGALIINRAPCIIDDALMGDVHYEWQAGDTDIAGKYIGEFEAMFGSEPESFPNDRNIKIEITPDLG